MLHSRQRSARGRLLGLVMAGVLVMAGIVALVGGLTSQVHPPQPPPWAAVAGSTATAPSSPPDAIPAIPGSASTQQGPAPYAVRPLPPSAPVRVDIPAIGVSSDLLQLGLNPDRTVQVPPLAKDSQAGWYRLSPTPGELGPAVILGHVDSAEYGPGVFFRLGALRPGNLVTVTRTDSTVATFRVDRIVSYPKDRFPTLEVYGNTSDAQLRLITCGGAFDSRARSYLNNIVVYATLIGGSTR